MLTEEKMKGGKGADTALQPSDLERALYLMKRARALDERVLSLQRQGKVIGTYAPFSGQEAAQIGAVMAMESNDWLFPTYRDGAALTAFGYPLSYLFAFPTGVDARWKRPEKLHLWPPAISIASHLPHAVGFAMAAQFRHDPLVVLAFCGDGATSEGDFHEALNLAGLFHAPVVLVIENNGYAISLPRSRQTASATLAQKAEAYGFPGVQVDGHDLLAVYTVVRRAVERARQGEGPTLIKPEVSLCPHTTADDPTKYRSKEELEAERKKDPLPRLTQYLREQGAWDDTKEQQATDRIVEELHRAEREAVKLAEADPRVIFDNVYAHPPKTFLAQRNAFLRELREGGAPS
ncbi:MAG: pyruvate dehydrogenase (acetyl-transferring) E1 component subunit alpha [Firmicutes bacterium]|nr:pyruvate dehydrogenase (acetyl-transferring) E1 component subunit alpha [Bacillota bacterium]